MSKIEKFEDLRCWQEARVLVKEVYLIGECGKLAKDYDTRSQLKRAALSTMNNMRRVLENTAARSLFDIWTLQVIQFLKSKAFYMSCWI